MCGGLSCRARPPSLIGCGCEMDSIFPPPCSVSINFRRGNDRCPSLTCGIRLFISNGQQFCSFERTRGRVHASVCTNITLPSFFFFPLPIPARRYYPAGLAPSSRAHLLLSAALRSRFPSCQMVSSVPIEAAVTGAHCAKQWDSGPGRANISARVCGGFSLDCAKRFDVPLEVT